VELPGDEDEPGEHAMHVDEAVAPMVYDLVPAEHGVHAEEPGAVENDPAEQD
jgi:hypothetical protein